jgi:hypothetical protein
MSSKLLKYIFFTLLLHFFFINKKSCAMCPLIYAKIITAPKSKIEKMKIEDVLGRKLFFIPLHFLC